MILPAIHLYSGPALSIARLDDSSSPFPPCCRRTLASVEAMNFFSGSGGLSQGTSSCRCQCLMPPMPAMRFFDIFAASHFLQLLFFGYPWSESSVLVIKRIFIVTHWGQRRSIFEASPAPKPCCLQDLLMMFLLKSLSPNHLKIKLDSATTHLLSKVPS